MGKLKTLRKLIHLHIIFLNTDDAVQMYNNAQIDISELNHRIINHVNQANLYLNEAIELCRR
jgi:hypothetical protein